MCIDPALVSHKAGQVLLRTSITWFYGIVITQYGIIWYQNIQILTLTEWLLGWGPNKLYYMRAFALQCHGTQIIWTHLKSQPQYFYVIFVCSSPSSLKLYIRDGKHSRNDKDGSRFWSKAHQAKKSKILSKQKEEVPYVTDVKPVKLVDKGHGGCKRVWRTSDKWLGGEKPFSLWNRITTTGFGNSLT